MTCQCFGGYSADAGLSTLYLDAIFLWMLKAGMMDLFFHHNPLFLIAHLEKEEMVSVLTTLERRFNLQSADVGVIASSFEIGNLALILFVSYFGARGHRPRLIGCGGIVMALGALLSALPEFLTHQYEYESGEIRWGAEGRDVCAVNGSASDEGPDPDLICRNRTATNMMYLLLIGAQVLLGIGATPVQPLGVSYIDDHVRRKDSSLYIGFYLAFSMCSLVYYMVVLAVVILGVRGGLNWMVCSFTSAQMGLTL
ncbi:solute carrier organic anion transporter family member 3A1-like protein [Willisornis vidua]|uniref:Solute carrier organic anion transporter family member 3A1-like protein n=1 Tax=Willisornis vidua TaxID=1566151 RepID=A0ABQ9CYC3_9PASS|nr:solute carrier organic anion transporter family member 3A1-like protein [Willisornis vidua]